MLASLLCGHGQGRRGPRDEASDADRLARFVTPPVSSPLDPGKRLVDLVQELALAIGNPKFNGVILFE